MKKCYLYVRCATATQEEIDSDYINSIERQKKICSDYAKSKSFQVIKVFQDIGVSGNNPKRPGIIELSNSLVTNPVDALIVETYDRVSRNAGDFYDFYKDLKILNVTLMSATQDVFIKQMQIIDTSFQLSQLQRS